MFRDARVLVFSIFAVLNDAMTFVYLSLRSSSALAAENLFLRKQLAMYVERKQKPRRATDSDRFMLAQLMRFFDWPSALTVVKPDTLVRWHLLLKLGIQISPRTVRRYMPLPLEGQETPTQRWMTFVRNHANAIIQPIFSSS